VTVTLKPDQEAKLDKTLERLMLEPITKLENVVTPGSATGPLCEAFNRLRSKYPFNATSRVQASIEEVGAFFQPVSGILSQFHEQNLKAALIQQGNVYVANPTVPMRFPGGFLNFFNNAMAVQRGLYPNNAPTMRYAFTLRPSTIEGVQGVAVTVNGQTQQSGIGVPQPMNFVWPGVGEQRVTLSLKVPGGADYTLGTYDGPWAMVQFLTDADKLIPMGNGYRIERMPTSGRTNQPLRLAGGQPVRIVFDVDTGGAPFIFRPGFFSGMACPIR
jgi:type VI protein secretion system component VasK